jgi:integrase
MVRKVNRLSARTVSALQAPGRHADGGGLYLSIAKKGLTVRRRWVFLFRWHGKLREMGLGGATTVSLAQARELAAKWRAEVAAGRNPLDSREAERRSQHAARTFGEVAEALYEAKSHEWRNAKVRKQWRTPLQRYAARLLPMPVNEIATEDVLAVLQPIWTTKSETASRLRGRIEAVLDAARARGLCPPNQANPARWRGHLSHLLPKRRKLSRGHHPAMPACEVPNFIVNLRQREAVAALALEFLILTASRTSEVLGARWAELDLAARVWRIPASRMKGAREHRVPLSGRTLEILATMQMTRRGEVVFSSTRAGRPLSAMAMEMLLRRMKLDAVTVHGFRSSFRDWAGDATGFPRELAEAALAHVAGDETERAYRRSDALERRRELMNAWAQYVELQSVENVVHIMKVGGQRG